NLYMAFVFFFSSRRRHTRLQGDWSSDECSSDLDQRAGGRIEAAYNAVCRICQDRIRQICTVHVAAAHHDILRHVFWRAHTLIVRSEERRVGKECGSRWCRWMYKKSRVI